MMDNGAIFMYRQRKRAHSDSRISDRAYVRLPFIVNAEDSLRVEMLWSVLRVYAFWGSIFYIRMIYEFPFFTE